MKVIIIKKCKDGNINDVIDVSNGYATNFLIKNKFAIPLNKKTSNMLKNNLNNIKKEIEEKTQKALKIKEKIENLNIVFYLKVVNSIVHGSITKKQILKQLSQNKIEVNPFNIEKTQIQTLGITNVKIKLYKDIFAILKIKVENESN